MKNVMEPLAATTLAVVIIGAVPNIAGAFEKAPFDSVRAGRCAGLAVFAEKETKKHHGKKINVMLRGYDPVAYFKQGKAVLGQRSLWSTYNGVTYFFASKANKADFDREPKTFEPQYGGFCANSMSKGKKVASDPNEFFIYKGKLYVCSSPKAKSEFTNDADAKISRADKNWLTIGPAIYNSQTHDFDEPWPFGPESTQQ
jgi:YHS domain-containing protein